MIFSYKHIGIMPIVFMYLFTFLKICPVFMGRMLLFDFILNIFCHIFFLSVASYLSLHLLVECCFSVFLVCLFFTSKSCCVCVCVVVV